MGILKEKAGKLDEEIGTGARAMAHLFDVLGDNVLNLEDIFKRRVLELFEAIKRSTPVDTGVARRSWRLVFNVQSKGTLEARIFNGIEYIVWLEVGSSKQAPLGMVRINQAKMNIQLQQDIIKILGRLPKGATI